MNTSFPETPTDELGTTGPKKISLVGWVLIIVVDLILLAGVLLYFYSQAPGDFTSKSITIEKGSSAAAVADLLEAEAVVRSSTLLYGLLITQYDPSTIKAGTYEFAVAEDVFTVAMRITSETPLEEQVSITFPEGFTHYEFNSFLEEPFTETDITTLETYEGYLFPDTYFVPISFETSEIVTLMQNTFTEKIAPLLPLIDESSYTLEEVIILASIIEREANDEESMRLVSGIIANRLAIGMALQVDASVAYGLQKSGTELTRVDLETDGPYNTYTRTGLPPSPIANPGLRAIKAVLNPRPNEYLFYITGNDGNFYYAETLAQHNLNIARYLR